VNSHSTEKEEATVSDKELVIDDATIVAFLSLKQDIQIKPFKKQDGKIAFLVQGNIEPAVQEIYENREIGINDYLKALKSIRNTIFTLRAITGKDKGKDTHGKAKA
jgi:hypothetical protein